jgi:mycothiol system anti-sigma-R factor
MIDCREAVRRMWTYLDRSLEPTPLAEFEAHLDTCTRCCGELEFSRHLRDMVAAREGTLPIPPDLQARIEHLLEGKTEGEASEASDRQAPA